jgi:hypothetical protein
LATELLDAVVFLTALAFGAELRFALALVVLLAALALGVTRFLAAELLDAAVFLPALAFGADLRFALALVAVFLFLVDLFTIFVSPFNKVCFLTIHVLQLHTLPILLSIFQNNIVSIDGPPS